jgi:hypothetical protein
MTSERSTPYLERQIRWSCVRDWRWQGIPGMIGIRLKIETRAIANNANCCIEHPIHVPFGP